MTVKELSSLPSADFAIDVWVSIYPANVDLILQARRYPLRP